MSNGYSGTDPRWGPYNKIVLPKQYPYVPQMDSGNVCTITGLGVTSHFPLEASQELLDNYHLHYYLPENTPKECITPMAEMWTIEIEEGVPIGPFCPSPYTVERDKNPMFTNYGDPSVCTNDMSGWKNMKYFDVTNENTSYEAARACYLYGKNNYDTNLFETYLPSIGELVYAFCEINYISSILKDTFGKRDFVYDMSYASSTETDKNNFWVATIIDGGIDVTVKPNQMAIRPFIRLKD